MNKTPSSMINRVFSAGSAMMERKTPKNWSYNGRRGRGKKYLALIASWQAKIGKWTLSNGTQVEGDFETVKNVVRNSGYTHVRLGGIRYAV